MTYPKATDIIICSQSACGFSDQPARSTVTGDDVITADPFPLYLCIALVLIAAITIIYYISRDQRHHIATSIPSDTPKCASCGKAFSVLENPSVLICTDCTQAERSAERTTENTAPDEAIWFNQVERSAKPTIENTAPDEAIFKQPPPDEACLVCFRRLSYMRKQNYQPCCGKRLCSECSLVTSKKGNNCCAYCRAPMNIAQKMHIKRLKTRMEANDAWATYHLGSYYVNGTHNLIKHDLQKGMEMWTRAADLGCIVACGGLGDAYNPQQDIGPEGVEGDMKKCMYYYELAAMGGHEQARVNLGILEYSKGNTVRAFKHYMIGVAAGHDGALERIQEGYRKGHVSKEQFEKALRAHKKAVDVMKREERDEAKTKFCTP